MRRILIKKGGRVKVGEGGEGMEWKVMIHITKGTIFAIRELAYSHATATCNDMEGKERSGEKVSR